MEKDFRVVATVGYNRIVTYTKDGQYIWEIQTRGIIRFWRWFTNARFKMENGKAIPIA